MAVSETDPYGVAPAFIKKLKTARTSLRSMAFLSILGGAFSLVFMLVRASQLGLGVVNIADVSFLVSGAVAFAIGLGLLSYSEAARAAGSMWFLAWGIVNLIVGFTAAWRGDMMIGIFCMSGGAILIVFADLLHLPAEVFVCAYVTGDLSPSMVDEGIIKGQTDRSHPAMAAFVATAQTIPQDPGDRAAP